MPDFYELPKLRDSLSYLYVEHAIIDRKQNAIEYIQQDGRVMVPVAALCVLMLGPGTSISHAAVKILAENGCSILWVGEDVCNGPQKLDRKIRGRVISRKEVQKWQNAGNFQQNSKQKWCCN